MRILSAAAVTGPGPLKGVLTLCIAAWLLAAGAHAAETIPLSDDERQWLSSLAPVRVAYDPEFAPFESTSPEGGFDGLAADYLRAVGQRLGIGFQVVRHETWADSMEALNRGDVDLLPCLARLESRENRLVFTEPYLRFARVVVTRRDFDYSALGDLPPNRIGAQLESSHQGFLLERDLSGTRAFPSFRESMLALAAGEVDAVVGNLATVTHVMRNLSLTNLKIAERLGDDGITLHMGVRKELADLAPLLNRALESIPLEERNGMLDRWIPMPRDADTGLQLTREERDWLLAHPRIRVGWDPAWAPIEFQGEDGRPRGYAIDLLEQLESRLGVRFVFEPARPWPETIERLRNREVDMVSCVGSVPEREAYMGLSRVYLTAPVVFFTRQRHPYIRGLQDLEGSTVAVPAGYAEEAWLRRDAPGIHLLSVPTVQAGLEAVEAGRADAFAGSVMQGNYYLSHMKHHALTISGETPYQNELRVGVRSDWPILISILDKALAAVPEEEQTAIYRKWVWVEYRHVVDSWMVVKVALVGGLGVLLFVFWNRRLAREVRLRTEAERHEAECRAALEKSYAGLQELERQKENLTHMIVHDMRSPLTVIVGSLDLALAQLGESDASSRDGRESILSAKLCAEDLTRMVNAMLDVSRLESGRMPLNPKPASLHRVGANVVGSLRRLAAERGVTLHLEGEDGHGLFDPELIRRVLVNLVTNAIQACGKGDRVTLRIDTQGKSLLAEVRDTGPGIDEQYHQSIFEKFSQGAGKGEGPPSSGVGLAFCRLAIEAHGGTIGVKSRPGEGSCFHFDLPGDPGGCSESIFV